MDAVKKPKINEREKMRLHLFLQTGILLVISFMGIYWNKEALVTDFSRKNLPPDFRYLFGTDFLGRDMLKRTVTGLSMSIRLGWLTAVASSVMALLMGMAAALFGKTADRIISGIMDAVMGIPHMLLLILIAFACNKGVMGVILGISLTHWMPLARLIRAEVFQLKESTYVKISEKLGMGKWQIAKTHLLPHLIPQFVTGMVLLFPDAILHEAGITFLGFGLPPETPAIGIILSESMKYLVTGKWWLAVFPGTALILCVLAFQGIGERLEMLFDPGSVHR